MLLVPFATRALQREEARLPLHNTVNVTSPLRWSGALG